MKKQYVVALGYIAAAPSIHIVDGWVAFDFWCKWVSKDWPITIRAINGTRCVEYCTRDEIKFSGWGV